MLAPYFFEPELPPSTGLYSLSESTSKHCIQVLRMKEGAILTLTDGLGNKYNAVIQSADKRKSVVLLKEKSSENAFAPSIHIAISFVKNASRMEWFLEKATEIGITSIYPLITSRTEKTSFKKERWENIIVSAMLQSQQAWKPMLQEPITIEQAIKIDFKGQKLLAHCLEGTQPLQAILSKKANRMMLIGPEGDFTAEEISFALTNGFEGVSLGATRLRTETAGMVAAALLRNN
jgi:16S rRNA (uracil1498-N3)-methyltransferase